MTLRFILGPAGSGKTRTCLQELADLITADPLGTPLLLLVPQQSTFIYEKRLASVCPGGGFVRAQVSGFARLAQRAVRAAGETRPPLSEAGQLLAMTYAIAGEESRLQVFAGSCRRAAFARDMVSAAEEMRAYGVSHTQLAEAADALAEADADSHSAARLHDIALLTAAYERATADKYCGYAEQMEILADRIEQGMTDGWQVWLDGFSEFTPAELKVVAALLKTCTQVTVCLGLDTAQAGRRVREDEVLYPLWQSLGRISDLAVRLQVAIEPPLVLPGRTGRFAASPELAALEQGLRDGQTMTPSSSTPRHIHLTCAADMRAELEQSGRELKRLVREQGWRYRDIGLIFRDVRQYEHLLQPVLSGLEIPFFVDSHKPLLHHPLVELTRAALAVWAERPRYRQMMRYLKNPLCGLSSEESDLLDNYCLAHGVRFYHWTGGSWHFLPRDEEAPDLLERVNALRERAWVPLGQFLKSVGAGTDAGTLNRALLTLFEQLQVPEQLARLEQRDRACGRGEDAAAHAQVWEKLTGFLEEASLLLNETVCSCDQLRELYDTALSGLVFATIPPGLDQVLVASLERSRNPELKAVFVLGVNEGMLPQSAPAEGMFRNQEREYLASRGLHLAPDTVLRQFAESYLSYIALTRPSRELYISYHLYDEEGKVAPPSPLLRRVRKIYPGLTAATNRTAEPEYLSGGPADLELAAGYLRSENSARWRLLCEELAAQKGWQKSAAQLERGLAFRPRSGYLQPATVRRLYGSRLYSSASRMERFFSCPFAYFAERGLRLRRRPEYELSPIDRGNLYHYVLADVGRILRQRGIAWSQVDEKLAANLVHASLAQHLPRFAAGLMTSSARYAYLAIRMERTMVTAVLATVRHAQRGGFAPIAYELPFGRDEEGLPAFYLQLDDGRELRLSGQIDRVDMALSENGEKAWLRVIDYKTGTVVVNRADMAAGLQLQLLTYLQVVLANAAYFTDRSPQAAGAYYAAVRDELIMDPVKHPELPGVKLSGLNVPEAEALKLTDKEVDGWSPLAGFYYSHTGSMQNVLAPGELESLQERLVALLKEGASALLDGLNAVSPLSDGDHDPCAYCDYSSVCGFERSLVKKRGHRDPLPGREGAENE